jgi:hypothetical protein
MLESQIQSKILAYLSAREGVYSYRSRATHCGVLDIQVCYYGLFVAIEVKQPNSSYGASDLQNLNISMIEASYGIAAICKGVQDVIELLDTIDKEYKDVIELIKNKKKNQKIHKSKINEFIF